MTILQYEKILSSQNGLCALCGGPPGQRRLAVDHDHQTGKVRALLCSNCNTGLGCFSEDVTLLQQAINYIMKYKEPTVDQTVGSDSMSTATVDYAA